MRAHVIENGFVVNTIAVDSIEFFPGLIDADHHGGGIGDAWDGESLKSPPTPLPDEAGVAASVRAERDRRLAATDWLVIRSAETGIPLTTAQLEYRQALRDITKQAGFPVNVDWPALE
jgi:hypothetical protein